MKLLIPERYSEYFTEPQVTYNGRFYVAQMNPIRDPTHYKFGFTKNIPARLNQLRCGTPDARFIIAYPCRDIKMEQRAIVELALTGKHIGRDNYLFDSYEIIINILEEFFGTAIVTKLNVFPDLTDQMWNINTSSIKEQTIEG